jgi:hypothetical protein
MIVKEGLQRVLGDPTVPLLVKQAGFDPCPNAWPPDVQLGGKLADAVPILEFGRNSAVPNHVPDRFFRAFKLVGDFPDAQVVHGLDREAQLRHRPASAITGRPGGRP